MHTVFWILKYLIVRKQRHFTSIVNCYKISNIAKATLVPTQLESVEEQFCDETEVAVLTSTHSRRISLSFQSATIATVSHHSAVHWIYPMEHQLPRYFTLSIPVLRLRGYVVCKTYGFWIKTLSRKECTKCSNSNFESSRIFSGSRQAPFRAL